MQRLRSSDFQLISVGCLVSIGTCLIAHLGDEVVLGAKVEELVGELASLDLLLARGSLVVEDELFGKSLVGEVRVLAEGLRG